MAATELETEFPLLTAPVRAAEIVRGNHDGCITGLPRPGRTSMRKLQRSRGRRRHRTTSHLPCLGKSPCMSHTPCMSPHCHSLSVLQSALGSWQWKSPADGVIDGAAALALPNELERAHRLLGEGLEALALFVRS
jgi:hypothetical protein